MDCAKLENDLEVAKKIWMMTVEVYNLVHADYTEVDGLRMLQNGLFKRIGFLLTVALEYQDTIKSSSSESETEMDTTLEMSEKGNGQRIISAQNILLQTLVKKVMRIVFLKVRKENIYKMHFIP